MVKYIQEHPVPIVGSTGVLPYVFEREQEYHVDRIQEIVDDLERRHVLLKGLRSDDVHIRQIAALALGYSDHVHADPVSHVAILDGLNDPDLFVRYLLLRTIRSEAIDRFSSKAAIVGCFYDTLKIHRGLSKVPHDEVVGYTNTRHTGQMLWMCKDAVGIDFPAVTAEYEKLGLREGGFPR